MAESQPRGPHLLNLAHHREAPAAGDSKSPAESIHVGWKPTALCSPLQWTLSRLSQGIHSLALHPIDRHHVTQTSVSSFANYRHIATLPYGTTMVSPGSMSGSGASPSTIAS